MLAKNCVLVGAIALGLTTSVARPAAGQETSDPLEKLHARVSLFLEGVSSGSSGSIGAAYGDLLVGSPLSKETKAVDALVQQTARIKQLYGEYRAFERVSQKRVGTDLVLLKYLYKCENFPVVWHFAFYRTPSRADLKTETGDGWRVIMVRFDTELELLGLIPTGPAPAGTALGTGRK